ncbi:hypothetical protein N7530_007383 [Penicillium desertorum]|uniref:Uncharacterized protein n=1 Tax=Penicillium desertorum TaxID=1303715 RepID=A0A9W9WM70_9EURO|nr:hypothetical protein N7530_007383 [Penicillium desertorum]
MATICPTNPTKFTILRSGLSALMVFHAFKYSPGGDFSYGGRYSELNLLFCRSASGYKTLTPSDVIPWNIVQENMDMLAACPFDDILK